MAGIAHPKYARHAALWRDWPARVPFRTNELRVDFSEAKRSAYRRLPDALRFTHTAGTQAVELHSHTWHLARVGRQVHILLLIVRCVFGGSSDGQICSIGRAWHFAPGRCSTRTFLSHCTLGRGPRTRHCCCVFFSHFSSTIECHVISRSVVSVFNYSGNAIARELSNFPVASQVARPMPQKTCKLETVQDQEVDDAFWVSSRSP